MGDPGPVGSYRAFVPGSAAELRRAATPLARLNKEAIAWAVALFAPSKVVKRLADYYPARRDYVDEPNYYAALDVWEKGKDVRWYLVGMTGRAKARFSGDDASFHADDIGGGEPPRE